MSGIVFDRVDPSEVIDAVMADIVFFPVLIEPFRDFHVDVPDVFFAFKAVVVYSFEFLE
jgi:hypothetical protein